MAPRFQIVVGGDGFRCASDQAVLPAMCGTAKRCIPVGCRSGGCGVCRVRVLTGDYVTGSMSAAQISAADRAAGVVLACQLYPRSDLRLEAVGHASAGIADLFGEQTVAKWYNRAAAPPA